MKANLPRAWAWQQTRLVIGLVLLCPCFYPQTMGASSNPDPPEKVAAAAIAPPSAGDAELDTAEGWNQRMQELLRTASAPPSSVPHEYRIGPEDLLDITVFDAPELNRSVRVSASGEISLPLLGSVKAGGITPRELEFVLQELLRRTYMLDPHVGVFVREMQSHPVSVLGAVKRPGVFQIRGSKTVLEMLSLAEGFAPDAGDTVIVMRAARRPSLPDQNPGNPDGATNPAPPLETSGMVGTPSTTNEPGESDQPESVEINLKDLLESGDPRLNIAVYPGDIVKVTRAGVVYVVGEVIRPGGFVLSTNEGISVVQAIALSEGFTRTASKKNARLIHTDEKTGQRTEIALDLSKILAGQAPDPKMQAKDVLFVPNNTALSVLYGTADVFTRVVSLSVFRVPVYDRTNNVRR